MLYDPLEYQYPAREIYKRDHDHRSALSLAWACRVFQGMLRTVMFV